MDLETLTNYVRDLHILILKQGELLELFAEKSKVVTKLLENITASLSTFD